MRIFYWLILLVIFVGSTHFKIWVTRPANSNLLNSYFKRPNELKHSKFSTHTYPTATSPTRNLHNAEKEAQSHANDRRRCWSVLAPGQVLLWRSSAPLQQIHTQVLYVVRWWRRGVLEFWRRIVAIFEQEEETQDRTCHCNKARKNNCAETWWNWDPDRRSAPTCAEGREEVDWTTWTKQAHNHSMACNSNSRRHAVFIADKSNSCTQNWARVSAWPWEQPRYGRGEANNFKGVEEREPRLCRKPWRQRCDASHQD